MPGQPLRGEEQCICGRQLRVPNQVLCLGPRKRAKGTRGQLSIRLCFFHRLFIQWIYHEPRRRSNRYTTVPIVGNPYLNPTLSFFVMHRVFLRWELCVAATADVHGNIWKNIRLHYQRYTVLRTLKIIVFFFRRGFTLLMTSTRVLILNFIRKLERDYLRYS